MGVWLDRHRLAACPLLGGEEINKKHGGADAPPHKIIMDTLKNYFTIVFVFFANSYHVSEIPALPEKRSRSPYETPLLYLLSLHLLYPPYSTPFSKYLSGKRDYTRTKSFVKSFCIHQNKLHSARCAVTVLHKFFNRNVCNRNHLATIRIGIGDFLYNPNAAIFCIWHTIRRPNL